jgi:hypothetical protein
VVVRTIEFYRSPNGERWLGGCSPAILQTVGCLSGMSPICSGGQVADVEIGAFLIPAGNGPEKQELLRLIGTLV